MQARKMTSLNDKSADWPPRKNHKDARMFPEIPGCLPSLSPAPAPSHPRPVEMELTEKGFTAIKVFIFNTNLVFLAFLYKIYIEGFEKFQQK